MGIEHRGFAALTPERRREIASSGGKAAQARGTGHQWTTDEARAAGKKGGDARRVVRDVPAPELRDLIKGAVVGGSALTP